MSKLLRSPKALTLTALVAFLFILGLVGGALGEAFGAGFLGSPLAHIQLPAESVSASPIARDLPLFGDFNITNTMVATWAAILLLVLVSLIVRSRIREVPGRLQGALEMVLEFFLNLAETVAGPERARRFLPLVITIFVFIVTANWMGILPGFGTIGRFEPADEVIHHAEEAAEKKGDHLDKSKVTLQVFEGEGFIAYLPFGSVGTEVTGADYEQAIADDERAGLLVPFLRSANTDINTTLAIALVAMVMVHWWGLTTLGVFGHLGKFINVRGGFIGIFVGVLEAVSEIARVISFTFRLFGNIFAGEVLLIAMAFLVPLIGLVPFLGLELFVGLIQAFIFAMLTLVFAATATVSHAAEDH